MHRQVVLTAKILGLIAFYSFVFFASIFITMSVIIKGEEIQAPNLLGKSLKEAYDIAAHRGVYLKKLLGEFGSIYPPLTVVNQFPSPGTSIKEKSVIQIFISMDLALVMVPDLVNQDVKQVDELLKKGNLKRGLISYITVADLAPDIVVAQSLPTGARVSENTAVDILASRGSDPSSFIMPDLIGREAAKVLLQFERLGLKISRIESVSYFGLKPGIVLKQYPVPGFEISPKILIGIQVSK